MDKKTWQSFHGFTDEDMDRIKILLSVIGGKINDIFNSPLDYEDVRYDMDKRRSLTLRNIHV